MIAYLHEVEVDTYIAQSPLQWQLGNPISVIKWGNSPLWIAEGSQHIE